jgi:perosamine synthetase
MITKEKAKFGSAAYKSMKGKLPNPYPRIMGPNALKYLQEIVDSGLTCDMLDRFEKAFAQAYGVKYCIGTPGCTPALALLAATLRHHGCEPGDEIIVNPITDYGTVSGIINEKFIPVFADTEPGTVNISAKTIEPCITDRTRAILCVHKTGLICDMDPINALARKHDIPVFEDVCQAIFGEYKGRYAGTLSSAAGFSFDSEKTMGADVGGCLITNDDELADYARFIGHSRGALIEEGFGRKHVAPGFATRMPMCTAAISLAQLEIVRENVAIRDKMIRLMSELIGEIPGIQPLAIPDFQNVYSAWAFSMSIDPAQFKCSADEFAQQLADEGITGAGTGKYYFMPVAVTFLNEWAQKKIYPYSTPPASRKYSYGIENCPTAWKFLQTWIRWATFSEKYTESTCELARDIVVTVADRNRK